MTWGMEDQLCGLNSLFRILDRKCKSFRRVKIQLDEVLFEFLEEMPTKPVAWKWSHIYSGDLYVGGSA